MTLQRGAMLLFLVHKNYVQRVVLSHPEQNPKQLNVFSDILYFPRVTISRSASALITIKWLAICAQDVSEFESNTMEEKCSFWWLTGNPWPLLVMTSGRYNAIINSYLHLLLFIFLKWIDHTFNKIISINVNYIV